MSGLDSMPSSVCLHGGQTIREKEEVMAVFASGRMNMLVVTSAVSRGLNITVPVNLIIIYDLPRDVQDFYERVCKYPTLIYNTICISAVGGKSDIISCEVAKYLLPMSKSMPIALFIR